MSTPHWAESLKEILVVLRAGVQNAKGISSVAIVFQSSMGRPGNSLSLVVCQVGKKGNVGGDMLKLTPTS